MAPGDQCRVRGRSIPFVESIAASRSGRISRRGLSVVVTDEQGRPAPAGGLARWLTRVAPARVHGAVGIALVSDARVRALNRQYRGLDYATDVLSFPASHFPSSPWCKSGVAPRAAMRPPGKARRLRISGIFEGGATQLGGMQRRPNAARLAPRAASLQPPASSPYWGDIVIARGIARRQAHAVGHDEPTELRVLALHGLLHLLGYDHERDRETMARVEGRLRRKGGLPEGLLDRATLQAQGRPERGGGTRAARATKK